MLRVVIDDQQYSLTNPRSISREILTRTENYSQAFGLPEINVDTVEMGSFLGDVSRGGPCNVNSLTFTPHNLTHIETAAHITSDGKTITEIGPKILSGVAVVLDLSREELKDRLIQPEHIERIKHYPAATILGIKTNISDQDPHTDFTGTDPIALHPKTTEYLSTHHPGIRLLILDLPSADEEDDGGLLEAHRQFFNLDKNAQGDEKAIIELAYFDTVSENGYYYITTSPARIDLDAIITDVIIYDVVD